MTYLLTAAVSFILGGAFGVVLMCLFQINRKERDKETDVPSVKEAD